MNKNIFTIIALIIGLVIAGSVSYYFFIHIPQREKLEDARIVEQQTTQFCACLTDRASKLAEENDAAGQCTIIFPDDTVKAVNCIRARTDMEAIKAEPECLQKYPRTTKRLDYIGSGNGFECNPKK